MNRWVAIMRYLPNIIIDLKSITNAIRKRVVLYEILEKGKWKVNVCGSTASIECVPFAFIIACLVRLYIDIKRLIQIIINFYAYL